MKLAIKTFNYLQIIHDGGEFSKMRQFVKTYFSLSEALTPKNSDEAINSTVP